MPTVKLEGHDYFYPVSDVLHLFYGGSAKTAAGCLSAGTDPLPVIHSCLSGNGVSTWIEDSSVCVTPSEVMAGLPPKREVKRQLYLVLSRLLNRTYPWGSLTGIRPSLVAREVHSAQELSGQYFVREDKAELAVETAAYEDRILAAVPVDELCVYIGVPFCRSRCSYCSFIAQDAASHLDLLTPYTLAVQIEIDAFVQGNAPRISCLYVGGGTPTVFDDSVFRAFMDSAFRSLCSDRIPEITVEAGRPDTITENKLRTLKDLGVGRICINPQTLSDRTLSLLGRKHTVDEFYRAFELAGKIGFTTINTDLIAGLPGETEEDFRNTLEGVLLLNPENITVHTLSRKKKAFMQHDIHMPDSSAELDLLDNMVSYSHARLKARGYSPYYLYRQKDTVGGHENTGYTREGHACSYNVAMMSDRRSVAAFGAGSVSKRVFEGGRLERCPCLRDPHEYIMRSEEMAVRKRMFFGV